MMPQLPLLFLLLSSLLLHPAAPLCVPRSDHLNYTSRAPSPGASPAPLPTPAASAPEPAAATSAESLLSDESDSASEPTDTVVSGAPKSICGQTDYPDVCLSSIQPLLPSVGNPDPSLLLSLHIKALTNMTEVAKSLAAKLAADPGTSAADKDSYGDVLEFYDDALDNLDAAGKALSGNDKGTLNSMLSALIDNFGDVEDEMGDSQLSSHDNVLTKMTSNSLAVAKLV